MRLSSKDALTITSHLMQLEHELLAQELRDHTRGTNLIHQVDSMLTSPHRFEQCATHDVERIINNLSPQDRLDFLGTLLEPRVAKLTPTQPNATIITITSRIISRSDEVILAVLDRTEPFLEMVQSIMDELEPTPPHQSPTHPTTTTTSSLAAITNQRYFNPYQGNISQVFKQLSGIIKEGMDAINDSVPPPAPSSQVVPQNWVETYGKIKAERGKEEYIGVILWLMCLDRGLPHPDIVAGILTRLDRDLLFPAMRSSGKIKNLLEICSLFVEEEGAKTVLGSYILILKLRTVPPDQHGSIIQPILYSFIVNHLTTKYPHHNHVHLATQLTLRINQRTTDSLIGMFEDDEDLTREIMQQCKSPDLRASFEAINTLHNTSDTDEGGDNFDEWNIFSNMNLNPPFSQTRTICRSELNQHITDYPHPYPYNDNDKFHLNYLPTNLITITDNLFINGYGEEKEDDILTLKEDFFSFYNTMNELYELQATGSNPQVSKPVRTKISALHTKLRPTRQKIINNHYPKYIIKSLRLYLHQQTINYGVKNWGKEAVMVGSSPAYMPYLPCYSCNSNHSDSLIAFPCCLSYLACTITICNTCLDALETPPTCPGCLTKPSSASQMSPLPQPPIITIPFTNYSPSLPQPHDENKINDMDPIIFNTHMHSLGSYPVLDLPHPVSFPRLLQPPPTILKYFTDNRTPPIIPNYLAYKTCTTLNSCFIMLLLNHPKITPTSTSVYLI